MATAGTIVREIKIAIDIVLAEGGKYYVDAVTMKSGDTALEWTEGPFDTEVKARESLRSGEEQLPMDAKSSWNFPVSPQQQGAGRRFRCDRA